VELGIRRIQFAQPTGSIQLRLIPCQPLLVIERHKRWQASSVNFATVRSVGLLVFFFGASAFDCDCDSFAFDGRAEMGA